jgi:hypothetical protein
MERSAQQWDQLEAGQGDVAGPQPVCPLCGSPASIIDHFVLYRTSGPVLHVRSACTAENHFDPITP